MKASIVEGKTTSNARYSVRRWKSRVLKGRGDRYATGKRVNLYKDGKPKEFLVARLVAMTFLGLPPKGYTVNHKDGNRLNNAIENLEWLTIGDNVRHAFETGLVHTQKPVTIKRDGITMTFRSMARLDAFLGRANGYTSGRLKNLRFTVLDCNGKEYSIVEVAL